MITADAKVQWVECQKMLAFWGDQVSLKTDSSGLRGYGIYDIDLDQALERLVYWRGIEVVLKSEFAAQKAAEVRRGPNRIELVEAERPE